MFPQKKIRVQRRNEVVTKIDTYDNAGGWLINDGCLTVIRAPDGEAVHTYAAGEWLEVWVVP